MVESLIQKLRAIEDIPKYIEIDRDREIREEFEREAEENPIVRLVMDRKTTFLQEYQNAFGEFKSRNINLAHTIPDGFNEGVAHLEACIGPARLYYSNFDGYIVPTNPIAGLSYALYGLFIAAISQGDEDSRKTMSRRSFLWKMGIVSSVTGLGLTLGWITSEGTKNSLRHIRDNAIDLDIAYTRLYNQ